MRVEFLNAPARRRAACLSVLVIAVCAPLASPAMAGCLGHPDENFCYTAGAYFAHNTDPGFSVTDAHSGASPQTAATAMTDQGWAAASADSADNGTLRVRAVVNDDDFYTALAGASLSYTFRLVPNDPSLPTDALVPLHLIASAYSLRDGGSNSGEKASFQLTQDGRRLAYAEQAILTGRELNLFAIDTWISVRPSDDIVVNMEADVTVSSRPGSGRKSMGVLLDPTFALAADDAARFTFVGLPLGPTAPPAAVPEPAAWTMMLTGFGAVGMAVRRRKPRNLPEGGSAHSYS